MNTTPLVTICCYCPDWNPKDPKNRGASHICCPSCLAKLLADLDAADAKQKVAA